jgi:hypothetical protein
VNTVPGAQSVNEDTTLPIAGVSVPTWTARTLTTTLTSVQRNARATGRCGDQRQRHRHDRRSAARRRRSTPRSRGLSYRGNLNFNGSDTLTLSTRTASLSDVDTVAITVSAVTMRRSTRCPGAQTVR